MIVAVKPPVPSQCAKLLSRRFAIFPVRERGKEPLTKRGFKDATSNPKQVAAWSRQFPGCNWGVALGVPSRCFVLDRRIAASAARYSPEPVEPKSETGRRIEHLSTLSRVEYDRVRDREAEELGVRVSTLDAEVQQRRSTHEVPKSDRQGSTMFLADPEPWPDAVNGDDLLRELEGLFLAYLTMPPGATVAIAL